jgi:hypothetical protein
LSRPPSSYRVAEARALTERFKAGGQDSFNAFLELVSLLFNVTVLHWTGATRLTTGQRANTAVLGGWSGPTDPLPLTNGHFLRLSMVLYLENTSAGSRLKVEEASYQYQLDQQGDRWVFRYDYLRFPPAPHPASHFQIRGQLTEPCLPEGQPLERIHFPVGRLSLEAVIRLLIDQFGVPSREQPDVWRPVLAETERLFLEIAHRALSGPEI